MTSLEGLVGSIKSSVSIMTKSLDFSATSFLAMEEYSNRLGFADRLLLESLLLISAAAKVDSNLGTFVAGIPTGIPDDWTLE